MINETQPTESKLKTLLLGTPEQRAVRREKLEQDLHGGENDKGIFVFGTKMLLKPGYALSQAIYGENTPKERLGMAFVGALNIAFLSETTYQIATKLGEYFAQ